MKVVTQIDAAGFTVQQLVQHTKEVADSQEAVEHIERTKQAILKCLKNKEPLIMDGLNGCVIPVEILANSIITFRV